MSRSAVLLIALVLLFLTTPAAKAQSPEMPEPLLVLLDADGKPMVQVVGIPDYSVFVLFDFDGAPARFSVLGNGVFYSYSFVFFSEPNCVGEVYLSAPSSFGPWEMLTPRYFAIAGPHPDDGTYRVFRSTSLDPTQPTLASVWNNPTTGFGECVPYPGGGPYFFVPGEEILPNPLDGFHGPTVANPERKMSFKGGTRLP